MIPRYQVVLFFLLLAASLAMGGILWHLRERAHQRLLASQDTTPTQAPAVTPAEDATFMVANDADGSMVARVLALPLPQSPGARARAVLGKLMDLYTAPGSEHPVPGGAASVEQVFLLPAAAAGSAGEAASTPAAASAPAAEEIQAASGNSSSVEELAVVNLTGSFASGHPSGIETETLTVLSICATLHANDARITKVRFLVDGKPRPTLAGHVDLTRTYLAVAAMPAEETHP